MVLYLEQTIWTPRKLLIADMQIWICRWIIVMRMALGEDKSSESSAARYSRICYLLPLRSLSSFFLRG